jgi:hypothetical protein
MVIFLGFYILLIGGENVAKRGFLSPFLAIQGPLVIFTIAGLFLLVRVQRSGATSRGGDASEMVDAARSWFARQARRFGIHAERRRNEA